MCLFVRSGALTCACGCVRVAMLFQNARPRVRHAALSFVAYLAPPDSSRLSRERNPK
jgi:hypothetical protein